MSFAPPTCRMPLGQSQCIPQADPGGRVNPPVLTSSNPISTLFHGSLALASLDRACRNLVPAFPQGSPPPILATAACGGLRSTPDCRPRRAFLHLSYSYAPPCGPALLVTQCRVEMWRGGCRSNISVSASFVWRCLSGSTMTPFPHPSHRTGHADFPHPALGQDFTPSPTARRAQAGTGARAQIPVKVREWISSRPCVA